MSGAAAANAAFMRRQEISRDGTHSWRENSLAARSLVRAFERDLSPTSQKPTETRASIRPVG
jgi:hypothetical protein